MKDFDKKELIIKAKTIDSMIHDNIIKNSELIELFDVNINEMLTINISKDSSLKKRQMFNIYFNPYILYFSKNTNDEVQNKLVNFIKYRYLMEKFEIDYKLKNGEINKDGYDIEVDKILNNYFYSSPIGINIGRLIEKEEREKVKTKKFEN